MAISKISKDNLHIASNRQRQEFDPDYIAELAESIRTKGLMHPIVVRDGGEAGWILVAGENRMRAMQFAWDLGWEVRCDKKVFDVGVFPCVDLGDLDPLTAEEAELEENTKRRDLTWQERARANSRLHELRVAQAAQRGEVHTIAATAKEIKGRSDGAYQDSIRKDVIVAKHLDNPIVANAKSADEAVKILKKNEVREKNLILAQEIGKTLASTSHTAINANCIEWMQGQEGNQFDVILTDPPYGMGADNFGDAGGKLTGTSHHYDDSFEHWVVLMTDWCKEAFRITKPQAHAYVFCDFDNFHRLKSMMQDAGWYVFRTPLIVHKINSGRVPLPDRGPRRQYEICLYAIKGDKPVTHIYPDVISVQGETDNVHAAQKPVALFQNLLQRSVRPGDKVLDTFSGSGTIFPAAHAMKCFATGIELNPADYATGAKRLSALDETGLELP